MFGQLLQEMIKMQGRHKLIAHIIINLCILHSNFQIIYMCAIEIPAIIKLI